MALSSPTLDRTRTRNNRLPYSLECLEGKFYELRHDEVLGSSPLGKMLIPPLTPHVSYLRAVGRAYAPTCDVVGTILYERNKEGTRG